MGKMTVYHGSYTTAEYPDIRKGRNTKNDQIYNFIADYIDGIITREQFWIMAKFKYPTHQINFCTPAALKCLEFVSSEEVIR